jgi:hypothetical protein
LEAIAAEQLEFMDVDKMNRLLKAVDYQLVDNCFHLVYPDVGKPITDPFKYLCNLPDCTKVSLADLEPEDQETDVVPLN